MYNITELENMDDAQLHVEAAELGIENPENVSRQELIYEILDQQAIVKAAADAQRQPKKRGPKAAEAKGQAGEGADQQPKKRGRKKKSEQPVAEAAPAPSTDTPAAVEAETASDAAAPEAPVVEQPRKKRGRPSKKELAERDAALRKEAAVDAYAASASAN